MQKSAGQTPFKPPAVVLWLRPRTDVESSLCPTYPWKKIKNEDWSLILKKFISIQCDHMEIMVLRFLHCYFMLLCVQIMHKIINFIIMLPWLTDNTI